MGAATVSLRNYAVVTGAYWAFTLTDGALRMLVLLHFHSLGYTPFQLAFLFVLYEALGALTNLLGGKLASRVGLMRTLVGGLVLQAGALWMLSALSTSWAVALQVTHVVVAQGLSGVAKDLTKLSAKSAIKLVVPEDGGALFKWVAILTGSKNALKGGGFFLGSVLLAGIGFERSLWSMAAVLAAVAAGSVLSLPRDLGRSRGGGGLVGMVSKTPAINVLAAARVFLFGARDVWFVVALPVFLTEALGWSFAQVGGYMAAWVVGYGGVQTLAPRVMRRGDGVDGARMARVWVFVLALSPLGIDIALRLGGAPAPIVLVGLGVFGVIFALNSSLHSFLVLAYTEADDVAQNVGFYYMANAIGRLLGTVLSGVLYQLSGLSGCLLAAAAMLGASWVISLRLPPTHLPSGE
jgi:hypothetical protein